ncbi:hypothetical protein COOONC_03536 [Cooperia oncophora]
MTMTLLTLPSIPKLNDAEALICTFKENCVCTPTEFKKSTIITCIVADAPLKGCYNCPKGAVAIVRCIAEEDTFGEILCAHHSFVVSCAPEGPETTLHFHLDSARHLFECTITCGQVKNTFRTHQGRYIWLVQDPAHNITVIVFLGTTYILVNTMGLRLLNATLSVFGAILTLPVRTLRFLLLNMKCWLAKVRETAKKTV